VEVWVVTVVVSWPATVNFTVITWGTSSTVAMVSLSGAVEGSETTSGGGETTSPCSVDVGGETTGDTNEEVVNRV